MSRQMVRNHETQTKVSPGLISKSSKCDFQEESDHNSSHEFHQEGDMCFFI